MREPIRTDRTASAASAAGWIMAWALLLGGCGTASSAVSTEATSAAGMEANPQAITETAPSTTRFPLQLHDAMGRQIKFQSAPARVASCYGSFAEVWQLAGGPLTAVTDDVLEDRRVTGTEHMTSIGSVKQPNAEVLLGLEPDFVLLSADIASHVKLGAQLEAAGIPHAFFHVESFDDYLAMLHQLTALTGRTDLYAANGTDVAGRIHALLAAPGTPSGTRVLLLRVHAKGAKALNSETATGAMLTELGAANPADDAPVLAEELSLEAIIAADPDRILITTMGEEEQAMAYLSHGLMANPAWKGLRAVRTGHVTVLPKALFQYKPNNRWDEAYQALADLLAAPDAEE